MGKKTMEVVPRGEGPQMEGMGGQEWGTFPGGELEGKRPTALCPACRARLERTSGSSQAHASGPLCFQCYRAELDRQRALAAAGQLETASHVRFQFALPFEPVNRPRLEMLKTERTALRMNASRLNSGRVNTDQFANRRRRAQIAARHALQSIAARVGVPSAPAVAWSAAIHAAELQLPESWLPFVVGR